jgi:hypothetical protein
MTAIKGWVILVLALLGGGSWWSFSSATPSLLQGVAISTTVSKDTSTSIFVFRYQVFNPAANEGQIRSIRIEISRSANEAVLGQEGLTNGPEYARHSSEDAFQRVPMVPVGIDGPQGWTLGLGFDNQVPPRGFAGWGSIDQPFRILPGQTREGFQLTSYGLPGIRHVEIRPGVEPPEGLTEWEELNAFYEQFTFRTKSVGPKAPPQSFVAIDFLNYLITLVHDSRQQGWIKVDGVKQSLLAKLINAKRKLEAGDTKVTKNMLKAFLNEVQATSCQEFECPGKKPLTSEAYALLFFNGQFLWERL